MLGKTNVKVKPNRKVDYVEYIESTGTQYINTGFIPNQDTKIEMEVKFLDVTSTENLWCARTTSTSNLFTTFKVANKFRADYGSVQYETSNYTITANTKYKVCRDKNKFYVNDTLVHTHTAVSFTCPDAMTLLMSWIGNQSTTQANFASLKLYGCKIWDNDVLVRDFKPCKDGAGVYCLYDEVEERYYYNQGTGDFVGPGYIIKVPENTKLLMKFEENLNDEVGKNTASLKTGRATYVDGKFGKAIYLPHGDYVSIPLTTETTLGTNNFTIAGWFMLEDTSSSNCLWSFAYEYSSGYYFQGVQVWHNSGLSFCCDTSSVGKNRKNTSKLLEANKWYHIALVRHNNTVALYVDGVSAGDLSISGTVYQNANNDWKIGASSSTSEYPIRETFKGKIDDFIIVNGTALWTANFTPPTHEYGGVIQ